MGFLAAVTLANEQLDRPEIGWSLVAAALVWGALAVVLRGSQGREEPVWLTVGDLVLATFALFAPKLSGASQLFYGGFPAITVAVAAAQSRTRAVVVASVLSMAAVLRLEAQSLADVVESLSQIISYGMVAVIVGWVVHAIFASEAARREAEAGQTRAEERSRMAAHLHDSVLQTLALIQRDAADGGRVTTLARRQERELRDWLYGGRAPASGLPERVRRDAEDVEDLFGVKVEVVTVGDLALDQRTQALAEAGREAMSNSAKHAGVDQVSVYLEATDARVVLYVRDRGRGFDPLAVDTDRRGISDSIRGRMQAAGGTAVIRSNEGKGTEVELVLVP
jgi:signal transduction histidine kinase